MLEISLSRPPARNYRQCLPRPARLNQRASWKTATQDVHEALGLSKCRRRKRPPQLSISLMARNSAVVPSRSTKPNRARTGAAASAAMAVAAITAANAGKPESPRSPCLRAFAFQRLDWTAIGIAITFKGDIHWQETI